LCTDKLTTWNMPGFKALSTVLMEIQVFEM